MISHALQEAIEQVAKTGNFRPLFDHFADDIALRVTITVGSPVCSERRGKRSVTSHLQNVGEAYAPRLGEPLDFLASGERIVASRDEHFAIGSGLTVRSECALVFEIDDRSITELGIHYELSPLVEARRALRYSHAPTMATRQSELAP